MSSAVSDVAVMQIQHMAAEMMQTMMQKMTDMSSEQKLNNGLLNQLMQRGSVCMRSSNACCGLNNCCRLWHNTCYSSCCYPGHCCECDAAHAAKSD